MIKVRVIKRFVDKYTNEFYGINQILEVTEERYKEIIKDLKEYVMLIENKSKEKVKE